MSLFGLYLRLGAQFNDAVGLHLDVGATTLPTFVLFRSAAIVDLTCDDVFTVGTGVVMNYYGSPAIWSLGSNERWRDGWMIGAPLHLSYKIPTRRDETERRAFGISLDGDVGSSFAGELVFGLHLTMGLEIY